VKNLQDFFVSSKNVKSTSIIRYINLGQVLVINEDHGYLFGGKRLNFNGVINKISKEYYDDFL
jgi:hypothetical protein